MLIETHAHLDYPDFAPDFDEVLRRANEAGVTRIITIGTSVESSRRAIEIAEKHANVFAVIGVHPSYAENAEEDVTTPLRELARNPRVVALGETGLDYHRLPSLVTGKEKKVQLFSRALQAETEEQIEAQIEDGAYKSKQASLFQQQLDLAVELGLNVVIHQRDAWDDTVELMRPYAGRVRGVFHCFGGSLEQAHEVCALGHLVSFTGIVTFKNGATVRAVAPRSRSTNSWSKPIARIWRPCHFEDSDASQHIPASSRRRSPPPAGFRLKKLVARPPQLRNHSSGLNDETNDIRTSRWIGRSAGDAKRRAPAAHFARPCRDRSTIALGEHDPPGKPPCSSRPGWIERSALDAKE